MTIATLTLRFPDIQLAQRDAHKLRGYFGNVFKEHSPLLHNHFEDGRTRYGYPLVQYKVLGGVPTLVGIEEGGKLLGELFFRIGQLDIEGQRYEVMQRDIRVLRMPIGYSPNQHQYHFETPWMALNDENYAAWRKEDDAQRAEHLGRLLTGNILSFFKGVGLQLAPDERLHTEIDLRPVRVNFKNQMMTAFKGSFTVNALLPEGIGLGKSVSRGLGSIRV
jgi:Cas6b C-terminal domain/Cas6b N-terminal domain